MVKQKNTTKIKKVLEIARENNIKFNLNKCKFGVEEVLYMGNKISKLGISPDENKIKAITHMASPKNRTELKQF